MQELYVLPDYQRKGIGKELIKALFRLAAERGFSELHWKAEADNGPALNLYRSLAAQGSNSVNFKMNTLAQ